MFTGIVLICYFGVSVAVLNTNIQLIELFVFAVVLFFLMSCFDGVFWATGRVGSL